MATMKDRDLLKMFLADGWIEIRVKGSHHQLKKGDDFETIAVHNKDMPIGELNSILKKHGYPPIH